jgi:phage-related minor tail protein
VVLALLSERASLQERLAKALGALEWFIAHRATVAADLVSAHFARGDAASEWMREDDRDLRRDFNDACERASQVHAELTSKTVPGIEQP